MKLPKAFVCPVCGCRDGMEREEDYLEHVLMEASTKCLRCGYYWEFVTGATAEYIWPWVFTTHYTDVFSMKRFQAHLWARRVRWMTWVVPFYALSILLLSRKVASKIAKRVVATLKMR